MNRCSLQISAKDLDVDWVSEIMQVRPDRAHSRGDISTGAKVRIERVSGVWSYDSSAAADDDVGRHLSDVIEFAYRRRRELLIIKQRTGTTVSIRVFWQFVTTISLTLDLGRFQHDLEGVVDRLDFSIT